MEPSTHIAETIRNERGRLLGYIRSRVRTEEDAEDILQDVFFQLSASIGVAEPIEKLTSWLFTVARNKIIDWYRKKKPVSSLYDDSTGIASEDLLSDPEQVPEDLYMRSLVWEELAEGLDELPKEQREVFVQHELEGKSYNEIARKTGVPLNTLLSRKRYAVLALRVRLREIYEEFDN